MSVDESMVIFGPIDQVGWASASSTVTSASSAFDRPRNGPPEAVSTMRLTQSPPSPPGCCARRLWCTAQCSLSTGTSSPAPGCARTRRTTGPAAMSDSLLASARRVPDPSAARVTPRPAKPTTPFTHTSPGDGDRRQRVGAGHAPRCPPAPASRSVGGQRVVGDGDDRRAAPAAPARRAGRPTTRRPSAATVNRSGSAAMTSSACVPIDPVDPAIETDGGHEARLPSDGLQP